MLMARGADNEQLTKKSAGGGELWQRINGPVLNFLERSSLNHELTANRFGVPARSITKPAVVESQFDNIAEVTIGPPGCPKDLYANESR